jgi:EmrB/QacA subfamily drug resistance transporter
MTNEQGAMTHREVVTALSGLLLGMLVAILSSTVVSTSLPRIISDLGGGQSSFTWVVTSTLLATTVSTPVWGKLADLFPRKTLVQLALLIFTVGSVVAGFAQSTSWLISCRVVQGLGAGGLMALVQVVLSDLVSPRERGRYMGLLGGVMGIGTVGGPLLGGFITDGIGWRWNFFVAVPVAIAAVITLQKTLHLPARPKRKVQFDYAGALLVASGISLLLIWISMAGHQIDWASWQTAAMLIGAFGLLVPAVLVERRAAEPMIPLRLFENRSLVLAVIASIAVGVALFGTSVFLSQYMQIARGKSPTQSGLLTIPMVVGLLLASTIVGQIISRTGVYKRYMLLGTLLLTSGCALMGTLDDHTSLVELGAFMFVLGSGVGMVMQNLVLVVQNSVDSRDMGAGSSLIAFFRTLGGATGVAALGSLLATRVGSEIADRLTTAGIKPPASVSGGTLPDVNSLPGPLREIVEASYAAGIAELFLVAAPLGIVAFLAIAFLPEVPLGRRSGIELAREPKDEDVEVDERELVGSRAA